MFKTTKHGINGVELADLLNTIPSRQLSVLALDVAGRECRYTELRSGLTEKFSEEMKVLDLSLRRLAIHILGGCGKRFTLDRKQSGGGFRVIYGISAGRKHLGGSKDDWEQSWE